MANLPPVAAISAARFGGKTFLQEQVINSLAASISIIPNNPNRVRIMLLNEGNNDIRVSNSPDVNASSGWVLASNGGVIWWDWEQDGEVVTYDVYHIAVGVDTRMRIREVIRG